MNLKIIHYSLLAVLASAILVGCSTPVGNVSFPQATTTFTPRQSYPGGYDHIWDATLGALDKNRIATISTDKTSGLIQTDYTGGPSRLIGLGIVGAQSTRYKYNITLRNQSDGTVRVNVICKIESTIKGGSGSSQWTDVSGENAALAQKLESWLYEQIEAAL